MNVSIRKHAHAHTDIHTEHSEKGEVNFEEQIFTTARINKFREISWFWPKFTEILQNLLPLRYSVCDFFSNVLIIVDKSTIKWNSSAYKRRNIDIWVVATSNQKVFVFQKICFKVKVLKTFKISIKRHIKTCRFLKRRAILKIRSDFL